MGGIAGVVFGPAAVSEGGRLVGELSSVLAEGINGLARLLDAAGGGDDDEMGGQRACGQVLVDEACADAEANTTGDGEI